jgi:hypothetical protein
MDPFRNLSPPLKLANYAPYSCPNFHQYQNLQITSYWYLATVTISVAHPEASESLIKAYRCVIFNLIWPPCLKNEIMETSLIPNAWKCLQRAVSAQHPDWVGHFD